MSMNSSSNVSHDVHTTHDIPYDIQDTVALKLHIIDSYGADDDFDEVFNASYGLNRYLHENATRDDVTWLLENNERFAKWHDLFGDGGKLRFD